jgi:hypothetical protein
MMSDDRIPCCIDGCGRSVGTQPAVRQFGYAPSEWICPTHWQRVCRGMKRTWARAKRRQLRGRFALTEPAMSRLWSRIKREAA